MPGEHVVYEGLDELNASLKRLGKQAPKELRKIEKDTARIVSDEAKTEAPRRSGALAGKIKPGATAKGAFVRVGGLLYTKVIHFGWPRHNIAPQPFLFTALDARREEVLAKFEAGIANLIATEVH
jgi:hypothetical protein